MECQPGQIDQVFAVIVVAHDDGVELDLQPGGLGGANAGPYVLNTPPARQLLEAVGVERVDADVDPLQARLGQWRGQPVEQQAIGSHSHLVDARRGGHLAHQLDEVGTHSRLTTRQPYLTKAQPSAEMHQAEQLVVLQQLGARPESHVFRHAVNAAQIAAVGEGDAEVVDVASEAVDSHSSLVYGAIWEITLHQTVPIVTSTVKVNIVFLSQT